MAAVLLAPADSKEGGFTPTLIRLAKTITVFTLAHSVTLSLAALGFVDLSPRIVESVIALSIVAAAINNIYPLFRDWTWGVVFAFGLFHGFGFASVLGHITQARMALATTLFGFNVGVELGQLAVIVAAFPILFLLRGRPTLSTGVLRFGSLAIALIGAMWFVERAFELG